jgi:prepilin-type N-terminal cleavage/methylation domain-containing protein
MKRSPGFTVIELLVAVAVVAVIAALAAPAMSGFIERQRLRSFSAALTTDLQFARAEAAARNRPVFVRFESDTLYTCYTLFTGGSEADCSCKLGAGAACSATATAAEVRTARIDKDLRVQVVIPDGANANAAFSNWLAFDPSTGSIRIVPSTSSVTTCPDFTAEVRSTAHGHLRTAVNPAGRISVCSSGTPAVGGVPVCPARALPC